MTLPQPNQFRNPKDLAPSLVLESLLFLMREEILNNYEPSHLTKYAIDKIKQCVATLQTDRIDFQLLEYCISQLNEAKIKHSDKALEYLTRTRMD